MIVANLLTVGSRLLTLCQFPRRQVILTGPRPEPDTSIFNPSLISVPCWRSVQKWRSRSSGVCRHEDLLTITGMQRSRLRLCWRSLNRTPLCDGPTASQVALGPEVTCSIKQLRPSCTLTLPTERSCSTSTGEHRSLQFRASIPECLNLQQHRCENLKSRFTCECPYSATQK